MNEVYNLTSNQYYGGMNRRFDKRTARLSKLGFKYVANDFGAFFVKEVPFWVNKGKPIVISVAAIHGYDNRMWFETLRSKLPR